MKQESLFAANNAAPEPLAARVRPRTLKEFVGQHQLLGPGKVLQTMIESDRLPSLIFWGPPGTGKTTLAEIIANQTHARFIRFSAANGSVAQVKKAMAQAAQQHELGERTVMFIDEIHRFNKAQQDAFLPYVEAGAVTLIGATTENPSFELNSALLSRAKVFVLQALTPTDLVQLLQQALAQPQAFPDLKVQIQPTELQAIADFANGDARRALNTLEIAVLNGKRDGQTVTVDAASLDQLTNQRLSRYDKKGDEHYNLISALHKSMRNSDTDAAIYWLSRMLAGGEEPLYIARRLVRFASEDIGLADTNALNVAVNVFQACQFLGMPECDVHLTEAVTYLSLAPKSNAIYRAREKAKQDVHRYPNAEVPLQIRNAPTALMKELDYGKGYQYAHDTAAKLTDMQTMPDELIGETYYEPTDQGREPRFKERLAAIKRWHAQHK
jgi:putative ATPase